MPALWVKNSFLKSFPSHEDVSFGWASSVLFCWREISLFAPTPLVTCWNSEYLQPYLSVVSIPLQPLPNLNQSPSCSASFIPGPRRSLWFCSASCTHQHGWWVPEHSQATGFLCRPFFSLPFSSLPPEF